MLRHLLLLSLLAWTACTSPTAETQQPVSAPTARPTDEVHTGTATTARPDTIAPVGVLLAQLPPDLRGRGQLLEAWRWPDANGENLLTVFRTVSKSAAEQLAAAKSRQPVVTDSASVVDMADLERDAELTARQYVRRPGGTYTELWHLKDAVRGCPLDLTLRLRPHSTAITDLDGNGRTETTLLYALACRGGIDPAAFKLVIHEGTAKYALRGTTVVEFDSIPARQRKPANPCCGDQLPTTRRHDGTAAGYYANEVDFRAAPPAFLRFARQRWQQFSIEPMSEHEGL